MQSEEEMYVDVCGVRCLRHDTSALEGWLIMHNLRRVLCGGEDFPLKRGKLAVVSSCPLMQKEIDFIEEMSSTGGCPPVGAFMEMFDEVVGVVDFEVREKTDLPGWDGSPNPVLLSNPHWFRNGKLEPVPPDVYVDDDRHGDHRHRSGRGFRRR